MLRSLSLSENGGRVYVRQRRIIECALRKLCGTAVNLAETGFAEKRRQKKHGGILEHHHLARKLDLGRAHAHPAVRHAHFYDAAHRLYPEKDVHGHSPVRDQGPGLPGRRQSVSGADDRARVHHRHGQHHRRRHGDLSRRPGRGAVVLADRRVRHRDQVRGEPDRGQVPRADRRRPHDGRRDVRARARTEMEEIRQNARHAVRAVCDARVVRHRLRHADQRHRGGHRDQPAHRHSAHRHRHRVRHRYRHHHPRRHREHRDRM